MLPVHASMQLVVFFAMALGAVGSAEFELSSDRQLIKALFISLPVNSVNIKKTSHQMLGHMYGVLNEIYLQNFLYGWAVNRETNLMSLLNL